MTTVPTPECDRMLACVPLSHEIGSFIDWLGEQGWHICEVDEDSLSGAMYPVGLSIERLLAKYFDIDLDKVEEERRAILKELQHAVV